MRNITIKSEKYIATICPDVGGNCIRLTHLPTGTNILRSPNTIKDLKQTPLLYGTPILIPPNRIRYGKCIYHGREYVFPLNEPEHNNHCHGELYRMPLEVFEKTDDSVTFRLYSNRQYLGFPHEVELHLSFKVCEKGLYKKVTIRNCGDEDMPFAIAFHTTFPLNFLGGQPEEYALKIPVVREFLRDMTDYIPTGEIDENFQEKEELRKGEYIPAKHFITKFTEIDGDTCEIIHKPTGKRIVYQADEQYKFRHIFNGGSKEFICVEPQTCRIDGLNVWGDLPEVGILEIKGNDELTLQSKIEFKE